MGKFTDRTGERKKNTHGIYMEIIEYNNCENIVVRFEDGGIANTRYGDFKKGKVYDPLRKSAYGVGFMGNGKHTTKERSYSIWRDMLRRCYDDKYQNKFPTYKGCKTCEEWYNYQNFADWYEKNYYIIPNYNGKIQLDKDLLHKGNKLYSPENCVFAPEEINYLILKDDQRRGQYPIGVYLHSDKDKYAVQCDNERKKAVYLGRYNTIADAFLVYKDYKEKTIKKVADKYYGMIPDKLYNAMYEYKVKITD